MIYLETNWCRKNIWKLACKVSLALDTAEVDCNWFVIKSFFRITHSMIIKKLGMHNFCHVVDLVAHSGCKKYISSHLIMVPNNVIYMSPEYILSSKFILWLSLLRNHFIQPPKGNRLIFHSDETQDSTSVEQLPLYATFILYREVKEHFIGLIPISKVVGTHLSAINIMPALESFLMLILVSKMVHNVAWSTPFPCFSGSDVPIINLCYALNTWSHNSLFSLKPIHLAKFVEVFQIFPLAKNFLDRSATMHGQEPTVVDWIWLYCWISGNWLREMNAGGSCD